jgi:hypothetical protein
MLYGHTVVCHNQRTKDLIYFNILLLVAGAHRDIAIGLPVPILAAALGWGRG